MSDPQPGWLRRPRRGGAASGSIVVFMLSGLAATGYMLLDDLLVTRSSRRALHDMAAGTVVVRTR